MTDGTQLLGSRLIIVVTPIDLVGTLLTVSLYSFLFIAIAVARLYGGLPVR